MSTCNQYESQSETTNDIGTLGPTTNTVAKERDRSGMRILTGRKTTTARECQRAYGGDKRHLSLQSNNKQDCSKGERLIGHARETRASEGGKQ